MARIDLKRLAVRSLYLVCAIVVASAASAYTIWRYVGGEFPGDDFFHVYNFVSSMLVIFWIVSDPAIPSSQRPSFDHVMLVYIAFPLLAAYQMYRAHRWKGLLVILALCCVLAAPTITLVLVRSIV